MGAVRDEAVDSGQRVTRRQRDKMNAAVVEQYVRADQESPTGSRAKLATAVSITRLVLAARTSTCWPMDAAAARVCVIMASVTAAAQEAVASSCVWRRNQDRMPARSRCASLTHSKPN